MIVSLNPEAKAQLKLTSQRAKMNPETYVKGLLDQLFRPNSMYMIFNPIPTPDRLNALKVALEGILNMTEFFGFKFLTKDEATQETVVHSKFAWCGNCADVKEVLFEGFVQEFSKGGYVGGDLVCQTCKSIAVTLYRPKSLLESVASAAPIDVPRLLTPSERLSKVLGFPKPAEELMLYDFVQTDFNTPPPEGDEWKIFHIDYEKKIDMWRRPHECQTIKDVRCDVCGRIG
jgi:hypothetical protein